MITLLKYALFVAYFAIQDSHHGPVEVHRMEAKEIPQEVEINIDDIRMLEKGEMPEKLKGLQLQEVNPKIEE